MCDACDGRPESHPEAAHALDADCRLALSAWPGGPAIAVCVDWIARDPWVSYVLRAAQWSNAGQPVGAMSEQTPALADGLLCVRAEWDAIQAEVMRRDSSR